MTEANSRKAIMAIYLISPIKSLLTVPIALMTKPRLIYPLIVSSSTCLHGQKLFFYPQTVTVVGYSGYLASHCSLSASVVARASLPWCHMATVAKKNYSYY